MRLQIARVRVVQTRSVWLIWFVLFIWLIWFIWFVSFNQTNETNQTNYITVFLRWRLFPQPARAALLT